MSMQCDFCQMWHSASSCQHPGRAIVFMLEQQLTEAKAEKNKAYDYAYRILMNEPQENGKYAHIPICNYQSYSPVDPEHFCNCPINKPGRELFKKIK